MILEHHSARNVGQGPPFRLDGIIRPFHCEQRPLYLREFDILELKMEQSSVSDCATPAGPVRMIKYPWLSYQTAFEDRDEATFSRMFGR